jgi:hypothetical protein
MKRLYKKKFCKFQHGKGICLKARMHFACIGSGTVSGFWEVIHTRRSGQIDELLNVLQSYCNLNYIYLRVQQHLRVLCDVLHVYLSDQLHLQGLPNAWLGKAHCYLSPTSSLRLITCSQNLCRYLHTWSCAEACAFRF